MRMPTAAVAEADWWRGSRVSLEAVATIGTGVRRGRHVSLEAMATTGTGGRRGFHLSLEAMAKTGLGRRRQSLTRVDGRLPPVCVSGPAWQPGGEDGTLDGGGAGTESHRELAARVTSDVLADCLAG
jgi:hypothetical protein